MKTMKVSFLGLFLFLSSNVFAMNETEVKDYFTVESMSFEEITEQNFIGNLENVEEVEGPMSPINKDIDLDVIINYGKKLWKFVVDNKPVVNIKTDVATALPSGAKNWDVLAGWKAPKAKVYRVIYKNVYGMEVVNFAFRVLTTYGGGLEGKGQYIARATIIPAHLDVIWGYKFNADVKVPYVVNSGTSDNPIGATELQLDWQINTVVKHIQRSVNFYVDGAGKMMNISQGN